jgi:hypothetical protein
VPDGFDCKLVKQKQVFDGRPWWTILELFWSERTPSGWSECPNRIQTTANPGIQVRSASPPAQPKLGRATPMGWSPTPHDSRVARAALKVRQLREKSLHFGSRRSRIHIHPSERAPHSMPTNNRDAFFHFDVDFALRITPPQPKLLCSSHLGETCPYPPDAEGGVRFAGSPHCCLQM